MQRKPATRCEIGQSIYLYSAGSHAVLAVSFEPGFETPFVVWHNPAWSDPGATDPLPELRTALRRIGWAIHDEDMRPQKRGGGRMVAVLSPAFGDGS